MKLIKKRKTNTDYPGVSRRDNRTVNKYEAQFSWKGNRVHLGSFPTAEAGYLARIQFIDSLK